jgi:hypothetical protein
VVLGAKELLKDAHQEIVKRFGRNVHISPAGMFWGRADWSDETGHFRPLSGFGSHLSTRYLVSVYKRVICDASAAWGLVQINA